MKINTNKKCPETSIIIRTRNEERWIGEVLGRLQTQTYDRFEIIVIDSGSTDKTLSIAEKFPVKIISIPPEEFTYPFAINLGIQNSQGSKYLVILSAHSLPKNSNWLQNGIDDFLLQDNVCGVYGPLTALPDGTFWDKVFHGLSYFSALLKSLPRSFQVINKPDMGVLGFTNAIIRRDLWESYKINEKFAGGGEDGDWANYWLSRGCVVIKDLKFSVQHSHYLSLPDWRQQFSHWRSVAKPTKFTYLKYRKDGAHDSSTK